MGESKSFDPPSDKTEEFIDRIVKEIVNRGFERPAVIYISVLKAFTPMLLPIAYIGVPFLEFFGLKPFDYLPILEERKYLKRLEDKIKAHLDED